MKALRKTQLKEKGWSEQEIRKAEAALERSESNDLQFSKIVFWSAMVVVVFANILIAGVLIPFLIALNQWALYSAVIILGGTVGFLYNFLITDIGHLERKHHVWAGILVPLLALGNIITVVLLANRFIQDAKIQNVQHNPYSIGVVFVVAFILPYILDRIRVRIVEGKTVVQ